MNTTRSVTRIPGCQRMVIRWETVAANERANSNSLPVRGRTLAQQESSTDHTGICAPYTSVVYVIRSMLIR